MVKATLVAVITNNNSVHFINLNKTKRHTYFILFFSTNFFSSLFWVFDPSKGPGRNPLDTLRLPQNYISQLLRKSNSHPEIKNKNPQIPKLHINPKQTIPQFHRIPQRNSFHSQTKVPNSAYQKSFQSFPHTHTKIQFPNPVSEFLSFGFRVWV